MYDADAAAGVPLQHTEEGEPVDEKAWRECVRLHEMFETAAPRLGPRKLRLFASACCRRIPRDVCPPAGLIALEAAERFADGDATVDELALAEQAAFEAHVAERERPAGVPDGRVPWSRQAEMASRALVLVAAPGMYQALDAAEFARKSLPHPEGGAWAAESAEEAVQCALLREVAGPALFREVAITQWQGPPEVVRLALAAYWGEWELTPILADALEEAGCADAELLAHLRSSGGHVRGCWAVDVALGRV
jgi:hypothetical protein